MHYYMFNKPFGCVCARRDDRWLTVLDYFRELQNPDLSPVGRLDRETEGLLFLTDDGKWNQQMTHPDHAKEKQYAFTAMGTLTEAQCRSLESGILLTGSDRPTAPAKVEIIDHSRLCEILPTLPDELQWRLSRNHPDQPVTFGNLTLTEGRKHQVRRMLRAVGCYVIALKRLSAGGIVLDPKLKPGQWKEFRP